MKVAVIGAGRVGTAVGVLLTRAGHRLIAVSGRGPTRDRAARYLPDVAVREPEDAARDAELVILGVPDDLVAPMTASLAGAGAVGAGAYVAHLSGALGLDALERALDVGAHRLAIHPLQTFPDVVHAVEGIPGCAVAVTADDEQGYLVAERIADDLLGEPFRLADGLRPLYHAAAVLASNDLVAVSALAAEAFAAAGIEDPVRAMRPLQRATLDNVGELGPARALTGPAVRGDAGTVARNLEALEREVPAAVAPYVALARVALDLAVGRGSLAETDRAAVEEVLARWS